MISAKSTDIGINLELANSFLYRKTEKRFIKQEQMLIKKNIKYEKQLEKLKKRFRHIEEAVAVLEKVLTTAPLHSKSKLITDLGKTVTIPVLKIEMACKDVIGKRFRVVYAYDKDNNTIIFLELYFKGDQENHTKEVILVYFKENR